MHSLAWQQQQHDHQYMIWHNTVTQWMIIHLNCDHISHSVPVEANRKVTIDRANIWYLSVTGASVFCLCFKEDLISVCVFVFKDDCIALRILWVLCAYALCSVLMPFMSGISIWHWWGKEDTVSVICDIKLTSSSNWKLSHTFVPFTINSNKVCTHFTHGNEGAWQVKHIHQKNGCS